MSSTAPTLASLCFGFLLAPACASGATTQRYVDKPVGTAHEYGTPTNTTYQAHVETNKEILRVLVFEQSQCEKIRVNVVARTEETIRDGEVVARDPIGPVQVADGTEGMVPCRQRYASDARVSLELGSATQLLGHTDPFGELTVNLSEQLEQGLYGVQRDKATLVVEGQRVFDVSLDQLKQHEARLATLLEEFEALMSRPQSALSDAELAHEYVLFEQLRHLSGRDPRVRALQVRFLEMAYDRKAEERFSQTKRNLQALQSAKELLGKAPKEVPMFVQIALQGGEPSPAAIRWARGELLVTLRTEPSFCHAPITWTRISQASWTPRTQIAAMYLRYAYDDPFVSEVQGLCAQLGR